MTDTWRYRFYQMQNGQPGYTSETHLFDLPISQVTFSSKLNGVGQLGGSVKLSDSTVQAILLGQPTMDLLLDRTAVYVELNGNLVWGGILQQADYQASKREVKIACMDWWGYFATERLVSWNLSYAGVDQLLIAADVVNIAQGAASSASQSPSIAAGYCTGGAVGVQLGSTAAAALAGTLTSGVSTTVAYALTAFKGVGQVVDDLSKASNGFDYTIDVAYVNGVPTKTFNIWYPRAGRTAATQQAAGSGIVFDMGGASGQDYRLTAGQTAPANALYAAGSGSGNASVYALAADTAFLAAGWPLLEQSVSYTDIIQQTLLDQVALSQLNQTKWPIRIPQIQYNPGADSDQPLGNFLLGDDCRLIIPPDPYFQNGYDSSRGLYGETWWRVVGWDVNVNDDGKSSMSVNFALPPQSGGAILI